jgi:hypothetical protein
MLEELEEVEVEEDTDKRAYARMQAHVRDALPRMLSLRFLSRHALRQRSPRRRRPRSCQTLSPRFTHSLTS